MGSTNVLLPHGSTTLRCLDANFNRRSHKETVWNLPISWGPVGTPRWFVQLGPVNDSFHRL